MRYIKPIAFSVFLTFFLCTHSVGQNKPGNSFYIKLKNYDLSGVFLPDSITDDENDRLKRPEPLGYIDPNYQRFQIHLASISKSKSNPYVYEITGKTKVKENICRFKGTITIVAAGYDTSSLMRDIGFPQYKQGLIVGQVQIEEDKTQAGSGVIKGKISTDVYFDPSDRIHYNALMLIADGFSNNRVEGSWTSYKTGKTKRCNWGDFRIPDSGDLDFGSGEFVVNPKYQQNGWADYNYENKEVQWWAEK